MPIKKRKCLLKDEDLKKHPDIKMEIFKDYSRKGCLLECYARKIQDQCGCLPYYFPDFSTIWQKDTNCNLTGLLCLSAISGKSLVKQFQQQSVQF